MSRPDLVAEARSLTEAGWSSYRIARIFADRGQPVHESTIRRWADPVAADRQRAANRRRARRSSIERRSQAGRWFHADASPDYRWARLCALNEAGLTARAIATVIRLDFGDELTDDQVRYALQEDRMPKLWQKEAQAA